LARLLSRRKIDILQTHLFDAGLIGLLAARLAQTPIVILTRHHSDQVRMAGSRFHVGLDRWMARQADAVVAVSHAVRTYMMLNDGIDGERIAVINLGFDFSQLSPTDDERRGIRVEFGIGHEFLIGCVASFFRTKGHRYLLAALSLIVKEIPNVRLLLVGPGDPTPLEATIKELGLENHVIIAGYRKDVPACMGAADIVVHPSLSEAFSQVVIEAMGVGTALIATDVGGAREVVTHRENGILVPPADASAIASTVLELHRNPGFRQRLAVSGQASVRRRFTVERMVEQQVDCYKHLLDGSFPVGDSR
jgi:glycosyltransferase involved in cell wall biosynthesis